MWNITQVKSSENVFSSFFFFFNLLKTNNKHLAENKVHRFIAISTERQIQSLL